MFSEGGGVGVLNEHAKEFCGRFTETLLDILPNVDDEAGVTAEDNPDLDFVNLVPCAARTLHSQTSESFRS